MKTEKTVCTLLLLFLVLAQSFAKEPEQNAGLAYFETLKSSSTSWDGTPLPNYPTGTPEIKMVRVVIPTGDAIALHTHPVINAGFLIRGKIELTAENDRALTLNAGDTIIELVDQWHSGKSVGTDDAEILLVYLASANTPVTIFKE